METLYILKAPDPAVVRRLTHRLRCHPVIAGVLANRGIDTVDRARRFFTASTADIPSPFILKDMDLAVRRIHRALVRNERILVFGDYDVDGVSATVIMWDFLRNCGARVSWYIPHRIREGYGLKPEHLSAIPIAGRFDLVITVDCGSTDTAAIAAARDNGVDVIVTDHHIPADPLPPATAVVNPNRRDCPSGLGTLAGVGVAFFLAMALRKHLREKKFWQTRPEPNLKALCDLVAVGTLADMVPLLETNRVLTRTGLRTINSGRRPGFGALTAVSGMGNRPVEGEDIAFKLAPRLNAAGRMDHAQTAFRLMTETDPAKAGGYAEALNTLNEKRRQYEQSTLREIRERMDRHPERMARNGCVLWDPGWHEGVLGIVASRLSKRLHRPVALIALGRDAGKGSVRSIPGVDLMPVLSACAHTLTKFGGHAMAAGITIDPANLAAFAGSFDAAVASLAPDRGDAPPTTVDAALNFEAISDDLIDQIERLAPFGTGNPEPVFLSRNVCIADAAPVGKNHLRLRLRQNSRPGKREVAAIWFNADPPSDMTAQRDRIIYRLRWNRWNGKKSPQLVIQAV